MVDKSTQTPTLVNLPNQKSLDQFLNEEYCAYDGKVMSFVKDFHELMAQNHTS